MTQKLYGEIDGRHLDRFEVGHIYEVGTELGNYLLAIHAAEPLDEPLPSDSPGSGDISEASRVKAGGPEPRAYAMDRARGGWRPWLRKKE